MQDMRSGFFCAVDLRRLFKDNKIQKEGDFLESDQKNHMFCFISGDWICLAFFHWANSADRQYAFADAYSRIPVRLDLRRAVWFGHWFDLAGFTQYGFWHAADVSYGHCDGI